MNDQPQRRDMTDVTKECEVCQRTLPAKMFLYSQQEDDHLETRCRTCRSWRDRKNPPSLATIAAYEDDLKRVLISSIMQIADRSDEDILGRVMQHRSQFESSVLLMHDRAGLSKLWKPPIWTHKSSASDYDYVGA